MSATSSPAVRPRWSNRQRWGVIGAALVVLMLVSGTAGALIVRHLDRQYGPVTRGLFTGPYVGPPLASSPTASGRLFASLGNDGSHAVTVTGLSYLQDQPVVSGIRWSSHRLVPGGSADGVDTPWHSFPATIPAHGTIRLLIALHHPADCARYQGAGFSGHDYTCGLVVYWKSLLHRHATDVRVTPEQQVQGLSVRAC